MENERIFQELKYIYPSLKDANYKEGILSLPTGEVNLEGIELNTFPREIFQMTPENLYIYLSNKFYLHIPENYIAEISYIISLFTQLIITEEEETSLKKFAYDFWLRNYLLLTEPILSSDQAYEKEFFLRRNVLNKSYESGLMASAIITKTYNDAVQKHQIGQQNNPNMASNANSQNLNQENNPNNPLNTNSQSLSQEKTLVRTKTKPGAPLQFSDFLPEEQLGIAGFMSTILILLLTIGLGVFIGLQILK